MNISALEFLILGLATFRVSYMLVKETGPFDVFFYIRDWVGIIHDANKEPIGFSDRFFAKLLSCVFCTSVWVGIGMTLAYLLIPFFTWFALPLAFSALAIIGNRIAEVT